MSQTTKAGAIFAVVFGAIFCAFGFLPILIAISGRTNTPLSVRVLMVTFSLVFIGAGVSVAIAGVLSYRRANALRAIRAANLGSPWLWRDDWASGRAASDLTHGIVALWVAAIFANAVAWSVTSIVWPQLLSHREPKVYFILIFPAISLVILVAAIRATIRRQRFGKGYFEFATLDFEPGHAVRGNIHARLYTSIPHGIDLRLRCIHRVVTSSGKNTTTNDVTLWEDERNVPAEALINGPAESLIPVEFNLPDSAYDTHSDNPFNQVFWQLRVSADVPGVDYADEFTIPVFRRQLKPSDATLDAPASSAATTPSRQKEETVVPEPASPTVRVSQTAAGTQFYFPAFAYPGSAFAILLFAAVWTGIVYFLIHQHAPLIFPIVFGFFDLILIYAVLYSFTGTARIAVEGRDLIWQKKLLGIGNTRRASADAISGLHPVSNGTMGGSPLFALRLTTSDGKSQMIAGGIHSSQEARWVAQQVERLLAMRPDTEVQFLDAYGAPPQRNVAVIRPSITFPRWLRLLVPLIAAAIFAYRFYLFFRH